MSERKIFKLFAAFISVLMIISASAAVPVICEDCSISAAAESQLKLSNSVLSLGLGEKYTLSANNSSVVWRTSDRNVLTVTTTGKVTAAGKGVAWITAKTESGVESSCKITVKDAPKSVKLSKNIVVMGVGEKYSLGAVIPDNTAAANRIFKISDSSVVNMTKSNWVSEFTALKEGNAKLKVSLYNGVKASVNIVVKKPASGIKLSKSSMVLGVGESSEFRFSFTDNTGSVNTTGYTGNLSVAKCSTDGKTVKVTGLNPGKTFITVRSFNGKTAGCAVFVKKAPEKVSVSRSYLKMGVGESSTLSYSVPEGSSAESAVFRTSNRNIVKMTKTNGEAHFTAVAPGTAWVTVRLYNGKEASCRIDVCKAPTFVSLTKSELVLSPGQKYTLGSTIDKDAAAMKRTYRSSNSSVVKMTRTDWAGEFVAVKPGVAYVKVRTYNGKEKSCKIVVTGTEYNIDLSANPLVMDQGDTRWITYKYEKVVSCTTEDSSVATVSNSGKVYAVSPGTTNVILTTESGRKGRTEIIVLSSRYGREIPDVGEINSILNSAELVPMKTNYSPVDDLAGKIIANVTNSGMSKAEKAKACYDYLATKCSYGYGGYKAVDAGSYKSECDKEIVEFSYCILKSRIGTCENFSSAYVVLLRRLGFDADLVYGDVGMSSGGFGGHYWIDVNVNGKHYTFDPQVENNCCGSDYASQYFYGTRPENDYGMHHYDYIIGVHGFKR